MTIVLVYLAILFCCLWFFRPRSNKKSTIPTKMEIESPSTILMKMIVSRIQMLGMKDDSCFSKDAKDYNVFKDKDRKIEIRFSIGFKKSLRVYHQLFENDYKYTHFNEKGYKALGSKFIIGDNVICTICIFSIMRDGKLINFSYKEEQLLKNAIQELYIANVKKYEAMTEKNRQLDMVNHIAGFMGIEENSNVPQIEHAPKIDEFQISDEHFKLIVEKAKA